MADPTSREELLERIRVEHEAFLALVSALPPERIQESGVQGQWSVKDIVAHVTAHEEWMAHTLAGAARGITPDLGEEPLDLDARNLAIYLERRDRSLAQVLAEFRALDDAWERTLQGYDDILAPVEFPGYGSRPVWSWALMNCCGHYPSHRRAIEQWRDA